MKKCDESAAKTERKPVDLDLELPDFTGMRDTSVFTSAEAAYRFSEEYLAMFPVAVENYRKQAKIKCEVEFVL
jgi:hypothetical protein